MRLRFGQSWEAEDPEEATFFLCTRTVTRLGMVWSGGGRGSGASQQRKGGKLGGASGMGVHFPSCTND